MRRSLLMVGRTRYRLPLDEQLGRKFDALSAELDVRVLASAASEHRGADPRFRLFPPLRPRRLDGVGFYALLPWRVARELRATRPDVVLTQGGAETALTLVARALARVPARVVMDLHGDPGSATRLYGSPARRLLAPLGDALDAVALRRADGVRTISGYTAGLVRSKGVEPLATFPAFMDLEPFLERAPEPLPASPAILFVGVLERYKAVDVLAAAWRRVARTVPAASLHIVGSGSLADVPRALLDAYPERVRWSPHLAASEVATALDEATVLVLPSRSEGLGRVVVEAFCRGRGAVGSRVGGIPDVVEEGVTGLLVEPGDARALATALERALSEPGLAEELGRAARVAVEPWLATPEDYARRMRDLVDEVVRA
jgi:glycosyltransferase involved in cell wall biosynthesis